MTSRACFSAALCFALGALSPSGAITAGETDPHRIYMVSLRGAPLIEYMQQRVPGADRIALRRELETADSRAYLNELDAARGQVLVAGGALLGRELTPLHAYRHAANGMALRLTDDEAARVTALSGVVRVRRERVEHVLTDAGPQWIGADKLWTGQDSGIAATKGEGVVIGIIDTGINPTHPSFAATGGDGYTHTNPRGHFYGLCTTGQATCNAKLIGMYDMTDEGTQGVDSVGHGSHVSGIAAGNPITDSLQGYTVSLARNVSGVAPHANLIMYKACHVDQTTGGGSCNESDLIAAIDQATADGVDVINYSIGGDAIDAYQLLDDTSTDAYAFFQARSAGVVIAAAAGNEGPTPGSLDEPGNVPWVIGAANESHNRRFGNSIGAFTGAAQAPPTLAGQGYTSGYGPAAIVYAGNYGNALCGVGQSQGTSPTGASNPFPAGTFHGEIVICDRGVYARVEKGYNVKAGGAGGFVLANAETDGESIVSDNHYLPAVHLGYDEGFQLKAWLIFPGSHGGTISGVSAVLDPSYGDILSADSSRGPYGFTGGILKPDVAAPGTNILSAAGTGTGLALLSGTSMATPHVAGAAALLIAAHPAWSPAQVESALLGTALPSVLDQYGNAATPLDAGAGRAQPAAAALAGLYLPLSAADIRAQDPAHGGDPAKLNRSGIESENCLAHCTFTRTVTDMSGGGTWQVSAGATSGAKVTVTPPQFTLASGASQVLNINVDVSDPSLPGTWANGRVVLHKSAGGKSATDLALTLAVYASPGAAPAFNDLSFSGPGGSTTVQVGGLVELPQTVFIPTALAPATETDMVLGVDPTPGDIYSTFPGTGKQFVLFPNPTEFGVDFDTVANAFIVEVASSDAPVTALYAGIDSNGDGQPNFAEQACQNTTMAGSGFSARCVIDLRNAGSSSVWALVDIPQGTGSSYSVTLSSGIPFISVSPVGSSNTQLGATGPGHVPAGAGFPLRLFWGTSSDGFNPILPQTRYYGAILLDNGANDQSNDGRLGLVPLALTRTSGNDDVIDPLESSANRTQVIEPGESLRHQFIDVSGPGSLAVSTGFAGNSSSGNLAFYVVGTNFPASSASAQIAAAPAPGAGSPQWSITSSSKNVTVPVTAGRWYIVTTNNGPSETVFNLATQLTLTAAAAPPAPGSYYNPQRSGHGVFLSQAAGQQALYWYTYLEDGTPIWYGAQNPVPASGSAAWTAPLFRVNWNGAATNFVSVIGDAIITPVDASNFMFSWHMNGTSGSEHFILLGASTCVAFNGSQANFTGQWYAPTQSGYGMDVLALPGASGLQFDAFYFYDSLGQPLWAVGSVAPFAANTTFTMNQLSGFCPSCAYTPVAPRPIGTLTVKYTGATAGSYSSDLNLLAPLAGAWKINQPIVRLTGSPSCN